ncbi:fungal-specific transcription factor domain-containing protein [Penicillium nucicola]|uniref:fungal-specific transcription factor domain-containing protein n=1 Tax=Penicillium nucicola TaxID=1850975 RepID=UPI002545A576|nr:fungal-specific transcription factor domain-containing protein [Penicillium nucicola]KAJ5757139.1 fungal-specific transcription factor domain-containing protein [Penicillium nucicola]
MENLDSHSNPYPYDTTRVSELLKRKRRVRGIKSCFPCRHRKVRCDGEFPCESCVIRGHPELCCEPNPGTNGGSRAGPVVSDRQVRSYESRSLNKVLDGGRAEEDVIRAEKSRSIPEKDHAEYENEHATAHTAGIDLMIKRLENIEEQISSLKADLQQNRYSTSMRPEPVSPQASPERPNRCSTRPFVPAKSSGKHFIENATGATIFLGSHSDSPAALGCRSVSGDAMLSGNLFLDQVVPRTYPFTSLWGPDVDAGEVCRTLPDDSDIIRYWQIYQTTVYPFYPALVTHEQFNSSLFAFLDRRAGLQLENETTKFEDLDSSWLALLFAVLACGVQFSNDPIKELDLRSKVFICSSFQCLRNSNFFNNTDMNQIQAMALIGHCLRNNLDTNSAWILMGATMRLAQSIGLHEETLPPDSPSAAANHFQRKRLWWMLLWQDTFLSFTYDRPPSRIKPSSSIPYDHPTGERPAYHSFAESVFKLCQILLERARKDEDVETKTAIVADKHRIEEILDKDVAAPFLLHKSRCRTLQDHLERLALRIHVCYGITRLCRLTLETTTPDGIDAETLKNECIARAAEAVESFLDMHRLSSILCRSWAFVHNAVSCALTLQSLGAPEIYIPSSETLVKRLVVVLEREESQSSWEDSDTNVRYFGPYSRGLRALRDTLVWGFQ